MTVAGQLEPETPIALPDGGWALFTTRARGNLSPRVGAGAYQAAAVLAALRDELALDALCQTHQVHGRSVVIADRQHMHNASQAAHAEEAGGPAGTWELGDADGQATALPTVGLMALAADCVPVALGGAGAVAILHAGWRGLAAGVLEEGVNRFAALTGAAPTVAIVGPCAGPCCYEAGDEVHAAVGGAHSRGTHVDLRAAAGERLCTAAVPAVGHVEACTICDQRFFSHRREGAAAGRQAGLVWRS